MASPTDNPSGNNDLVMMKNAQENVFASGISTYTADQTRAVARERSIIEGIERGLADLQAGNTVPHDVAMAELGSLIDGLSGLR